MPSGCAPTANRTVVLIINIGHLLRSRLHGECQTEPSAVQRINARQYSPRHADSGRAVHRHAGSHRTATESRWSVHRLRDGVGRVRCVDDRHAGWITRSSTHRLPATTTGPRFRRGMLVLERRRHSVIYAAVDGNLWLQPVPAGSVRRLTQHDPDENRGRPGGECRRKPCRVCPRRGRGVGDATRRRFERATRRRHRRFRLRPLPDAVQQRRRVAGVERARHAVGSRRVSNGPRSIEPAPTSSVPTDPSNRFD